MNNSEVEPFPIDRETFLRFRRSTPEERLNWLEELRELNEQTLTPEIKKRREFFRNPGD